MKPSFVQILYASAALASAVATLAAWIAKIVWSKEYAATKEQEIRAKDATIQSLDAAIKSLEIWSSPRLKEYYLSVKTGLEEVIDGLQSDISEYRGKVEDLQKEIHRLQSQPIGQANVEEAQTLLLDESSGLIDRIAQKEEQVRALSMAMKNDLAVGFHDLSTADYIRQVLAASGMFSERDLLSAEHVKRKFGMLAPCLSPDSLLQLQSWNLLLPGGELTDLGVKFVQSLMLNATFGA